MRRSARRDKLLLVLGRAREALYVIANLSFHRAENHTAESREINALAVRAMARIDEAFPGGRRA